MLTQKEADYLIGILKKIIDTESTFQFPKSGNCDKIELMSDDDKYKFVIDVNRHGKIKVLKCTYQNRYQKEDILLRLDVNGPPHTNPDGAVISGCHLHIYREDYGDKWAYELPAKICHTDNLLKTLFDFLSYCNVKNLDKFTTQEVL